MSTIQENLRATLLSLKQISDRLKSLVTNSSTKTDISNAKGDIITAIGNIPEPDLSSLATEANATANKNAIIAAIPSVANIQNGLATSSALSSVATDASAAKTAAQAITGYATETNATANKNAILQAISDNAGVPTLTIPSTTASQELAPNTLYIFSSRSTALILTLGTPITGIANEYHLFLVTDSSTAPTVTWPSGISWNGGSAPSIAANKTYEVSILNNVAAFFEI